MCIRLDSERNILTPRAGSFPPESGLSFDGLLVQHRPDKLPALAIAITANKRSGNCKKRDASTSRSRLRRLSISRASADRDWPKAPGSGLTDWRRFRDSLFARYLCFEYFRGLSRSCGALETGANMNFLENFLRCKTFWKLIGFSFSEYEW